MTRLSILAMTTLLLGCASGSLEQARIETREERNRAAEAVVAGELAQLQVATANLVNELDCIFGEWTCDRVE